MRRFVCVKSALRADACKRLASSYAVCLASKATSAPVTMSPLMMSARRAQPDDDGAGRALWGQLPAAIAEQAAAAQRSGSNWSLLFARQSGASARKLSRQPPAAGSRVNGNSPMLVTSALCHRGFAACCVRVRVCVCSYVCACLRARLSACACVRLCALKAQNAQRRFARPQSVLRVRAHATRAHTPQTLPNVRFALPKARARVSLALKAPTTKTKTKTKTLRADSSFKAPRASFSRI